MVFVFYVVANCAQIYDAFAGGRCHGKGSQMQDRSQDRCGGCHGRVLAARLSPRSRSRRLPRRRGADMVFVFYVVANCAQIYDAFAGGRCHGKGSQMQDRSQDRCGGVSREGSRSGATCLVQSNHKPFGLTYTR